MSRLHPPSTKTQRGHPLWWRYYGMMNRCHNPSAINFPHYGGRGIQVCSSWRDNFDQFVVDMLPGFLPGLQIDRIDNDGHYTRGNCRWVTTLENRRNRSNHIYARLPSGDVVPLPIAAEVSGVKYKTLIDRIRVQGVDPLDPVALYASQRGKNR